MRAAAVSHGFVRDVETDFAYVAALIEQARAAGVELLVLPEAALGGYLGSLGDDPLSAGLPPALALDGPEIARLAALAGDMVVCAGLAEASPDGAAYNTAVCVSGDGLLGVHRKVHAPLNEGAAYAQGSCFEAFDTPVGRLGMAICYDKAFPESARTLALDGAEVLCLLSSWPLSRTNRAPRMEDDRQVRMFDLYDQARAVENQMYVVSANQWGTFGELTLLGRAKCVSPSGEVLATTGCAPGLAVADLDIGLVRRTRSGGMGHLRDLRPDAYAVSVHA